MTLDEYGPPPQLRWRYYLWEVRLPPTWHRWAEQDISSLGWIMREISRFVVTFGVLIGLVGGWRITRIAAACLFLGVSIIAAAREPLRRVALAYQRYGLDWDSAPNLGVAPYIRVALAWIFSIVIVALVISSIPL